MCPSLLRAGSEAPVAPAAPHPAWAGSPRTLPDRRDRGGTVSDLPGSFAALLHGDLVRLPLVLGHWGHKGRR